MYRPDVCTIACTLQELTTEMGARMSALLVRAVRVNIPEQPNRTWCVYGICLLRMESDERCFGKTNTTFSGRRVHDIVYIFLGGQRPTRLKMPGNADDSDHPGASSPIDARVQRNSRIATLFPQNETSTNPTIHPVATEALSEKPQHVAESSGVHRINFI